jgi:hypothetical protein
VLSQAAFSMSKIAVNETYNVSTIRKAIDYFGHLTTAPELYSQTVDINREFASTEYCQKITWLKNENDDLYDQNYKDLLRVVFTSGFSRRKPSDLVSLLSGRNFETRTYEEKIARGSLKKLEEEIHESIKRHQLQTLSNDHQICRFYFFQSNPRTKHT